MAAHRYWRLYVRGTAGTWIGMAELELRDSIGGADRTGSGTATASVQYNGWDPGRIVDNNPATMWATYTATPPQWWAYDFGAGSAYDIVQLSITPRTDGFYAEAPRDFDVQFQR